MSENKPELEIVVGRFYRAKKPAMARGFVNDRQVRFISGSEVQYDGPAVAIGRRLPIVSMADFLKWAGSDVTDSLPKDEWATWPLSKAERAA